MSKGYRSTILCVIASCSFAASASTSPWSVGVGAVYSPKVYKGTPSHKTVIPLIGYEGEHFFFRGLSAGYRLNPRRSVHNFVIKAMYDPRTFKPTDSNLAYMRLLEERKYTVLGGVSYQYMSSIGMLEATLGTDLLGVHDGLYGEVAWRLPIRFKRGGITPAIGYSYNDDKLNQHFYGVSKYESDKLAGRMDEFNIHGSGQYFVGISSYFLLSKSVRLNAGIRYTNLEGDIENSPLLDTSVSTTGHIGITYSF